MKRSQQQHTHKKISEVMGREKLFSAPGSVLIKTTLLKLLAEADRQRSYQNKYGEMWPNGQSFLHSALAHFWCGVLVLQLVEMLG